MKWKAVLYAGTMLILITGSFAWINREKAIAKTQVYPVQKQGTIHLNKEVFLSRVANFETSSTEWKYLGDKPCIVDFYASWCGPCKIVAPILEDLAKKYDGQINIYKVNIDAEEEIAGAYGIHSIPTILFCPVHGAPQMAQGAMSEKSFIEAIDDILLKNKNGKK